MNYSIKKKPDNLSAINGPVCNAFISTEKMMASIQPEVQEEV